LNRILGFASDASPTLEMLRERYFPGERERVQQEAKEAFAGAIGTSKPSFAICGPMANSGGCLSGQRFNSQLKAYP
jgi:hypothetical protein